MGQIIMVKGKRLIDGTGQAPIEDAVLVAEEGRITKVGPSCQVKPPQGEGVLLIDAGEGSILPGFIDVHVHLSFSGTQISSLDHPVSPEEATFRTVRNAQLALLGGLTTVRDAGGPSGALLAIRNAIRDGRMKGPLVETCGEVITITGGHLHVCGIEADTPEEVRKAVRILCKQGVDFIKYCGDGGYGSPFTKPWVPQYKLPCIEALIDEAHHMGRQVTAHAAGTESIRYAVKAGIDCIEHATFRGREGHDYDEKVVEQIITKGIYVSMGFMMFPSQPNADTPYNHLREVKLESYRSYRKMAEAGVKFIISSDGGSIAARINEFGRLLESIVTQWMPPLEAIYRSTLLPAQYIRQANNIGSLEVGKQADLIIVSGNPLVDATAFNRVDTVVKNGEVVVRGGMLRVWS